MDESWRVKMGVPPNGGRRTHHRRRNSTAGRVSNSETGFEPEDFDDVFGGPPRSVLDRKLSSVDFTAPEWFYQDIFKQQPESHNQAIIDGRRLPKFEIPEEKMSKRKMKSISRSKSTCSSVLSYEELNEISPYRPPGTNVGEEDAGLSSFTSRLRRITVPPTWSSMSISPVSNSRSTKQELPAFKCTSSSSSYVDSNQFIGSECDAYVIKSFKFEVPDSKDNVAETLPSYPTTLKMSSMIDSHVQPNLSYLGGHQGNNNTSDDKFEENMLTPQQTCTIDVEDQVMMSYGVDHTNDHMYVANNLGATAVDEAIAWAKERFQGWGG